MSTIAFTIRFFIGAAAFSVGWIVGCVVWGFKDGFKRGEKDHP